MNIKECFENRLLRRGRTDVLKSKKASEADDSIEKAMSFINKVSQILNKI